MFCFFPPHCVTIFSYSLHQNPFNGNSRKITQAFITPVLSARNRFIAERIYKVKPSGIRRFFGIAAKMPDVISLGIGEPDFTTPEPLFQAGFDSVMRGVTNYTANSGLIDLREKLSEH